MKTIAIFLNLECLPFELNIPNLSTELDERVRAAGPKGYLGKAMAITDSRPFAILFAYDDNAIPELEILISTAESIIGQAALAYGGWSFWDLIKPKCFIDEFTKDEMPDLYAQLVSNLKINQP